MGMCQLNYKTINLHYKNKRNLSKELAYDNLVGEAIAYQGLLVA